MINIMILVVLSGLFIISPRNSIAQHATFDVNATQSDSAKDAAIDYALSIWSQHIKSNVPIKIRVKFKPLTVLGPLAITFPNGIKNFQNAPVQDVWYPTCLANAIANQELNPGEPDMEIQVNTDFNWYYGTDGSPGPTQYDFVSVFLHEVGHGIGFLSLAKVDGDGSFGNLTEADFSIFNMNSFTWKEQEGLPSVFDQFIIDGGDNNLTDTMIYKNPSSSLRVAFTNDNIYFNGENSVSANDSIKVKLYAPNTFNLGSSVLHFDEDIYPPGDTNELMTPFHGQGEVNHAPGPVFSGLLQDIGWPESLPPPASVAKRRGFEDNNIKVGPNPFIEFLQLEFSSKSNNPIFFFIYNLQGELIYRKELNVSQRYSLTIPSNEMNIPQTSLCFYKVVQNNRIYSGSLLYVK